MSTGNEGMNSWRNESQIWMEAYGSKAEVKRRRLAMPNKLRLLGLDGVHHSAAILDLCCGHCETLDTLFDMGFRNLNGIDIALPKNIQNDLRFTLKIGDARKSNYPDASMDWILIIHALHHLGNASDIDQLLSECYRILKPGGRLGIVDFPNSLPIRLAFWWFRQNIFQWTPYLQNFGMVVREEWHFLKEYLPQWPRVQQLLINGVFDVVSNKKTLFYYYLVLKKGTL